MADSDTETSSLKLVRFHGKRGEDYGLWRMRLRAACRVKGVWKVVESTSETTSQTSLASTSLEKDSQQPSSSVSVPEKHLEKLEKASAIIISTLGDAPLRVIMEADDDPSKMLRLLDARYASSRTVSRIAVQTQLFRMSYKGQNMSSYIDQFTSLFSQLERMGKDAAIPETHKAPMLLASIDPYCSLESTAAALRTKAVSELTWDYVATTLIDEYNAREMSKPNGSGSSSKSKKKKNKSKSSNMSSSMESGHDAHSDDDSDIDKTVQAFSAALKSSMGSKSSDSTKCDFCGRRGHTEERCFLNPDNPNNKLTPKMKAVMSNKGSNPTSGNPKMSGGNGKPKVELAGSLVEKTTVNAPKDYRTYADSGATTHCFFNERVFVPNSIVSCDDRTIEMADKSTVTSNKLGEVILFFKHVNIRLQKVLYVPSMGYNLVSTGRLADNGIESLFRRHDFVLQLESDATTIGQGDRDSSSGLYVFPNQNLDITLIMSEHNVSDTFLWHRRLAHINMQDLYNVHNHADGIPKLTRPKTLAVLAILEKHTSSHLAVISNQLLVLAKSSIPTSWASSKCLFPIDIDMFAHSSMDSHVTRISGFSAKEVICQKLWN